MHIKTKGLVLRETKYRDADTLLTLLTDTEGKITVRARGVLRKGSRITAACQLLSWSDFTLFGTRDRFIVDQAEPLDMFIELREDVQKLALGAYVAELLEAAGDADADGEELRLGLNTLYATARLNKSLACIKSVFELRLACAAGYEPAAEACEVCGREPESAFFNLHLGILHCKSCRTEVEGGISLPVTPEVLSALRYIISCPHKKIFSYEITPAAQSMLSELTEAYLMSQFERPFQTLAFYKSLLYAGEKKEIK